MTPRSVRLTILLAMAFLMAAALAPTRVFAQSNQIHFTSVSHNFGSLAAGQSAQYGVQMTNGGAAAFPFALTLSGPKSFTYAHNCGGTLAAAASCEIVFTFAPTAAGSASATWTLGTNGFDFAPSNGGTLSGSQQSAQGLTLTTDGHDFGTQGVLVPSGTYGVVLSNMTDDAITLTINTAPAESVDLPLTGNTCGIILAANTSCNLNWQFIPQAAHGYQSFYGISGVDSVTSQPVVLTSGGAQVNGVQLEGVGINANGVTLASSGNKFAEQGVHTISPSYITVLVNGTPSAVSLVYSGANANYVSTGNNCPTTLAAWQSCQMRWVFEPQTPGYAELVYNIAVSDIVGNPVVLTSGGQSVAGVTLTGTGIAGTVSLRTDGHNFGPWLTGTTSYKYFTILSNSTPEAVNLKYAYSNSNHTQYNLTADTCGATLLAGASCDLQWDFSPATTGPIGTTYDISAKDACGCQPISITTGMQTVPGVLLAGNGQATAGLSLASASHMFGEQGIGGGSATYGTVLYNTTGMAVNLTYVYSSPTAGANFKITANDCTATMAANTSCNVQWQFMPVTSGAISVVYNITATQGGSPVTLTSYGSPVNGVTLSGTGVE
jgi:hypothetical protein